MHRKIIFFIISLFCSAFLHAQTYYNDSLFGLNGEANPTILNSFSFTEQTLLSQPDGKLIYCASGDARTGEPFVKYIDMVRFTACGQIDSSFGTNGIVHKAFMSTSQPLSFLLQTDGKIACAGVQSPSNSSSLFKPFVARFNANGSLDSSFNGIGYADALSPTGVAPGRFSSIQQVPNNKYLLGVRSGSFSQSGMGAIRLKQNGHLDSSFATNGKFFLSVSGLNHYNAHAFRRPDSSIIIAGVRDDLNDGHFKFTTTACSDDGIKLNSFGNSGVFTLGDDLAGAGFSQPTAMALQPDGKLLMAHLIYPTVSAGFLMVRINMNGSLDTTFAGTGKKVITYPQTPDNAHEIFIMSDNSIVFSFAAADSIHLVKLKPNGVIDSSFGINGFQRLIRFPGASFSIVPAGVCFLKDNRIMGAMQAGTKIKLIRKSMVNNVPRITYSIPVLSTTGIGTFQWFLNGTNISGATTNTHTALIKGTYAVQISDTFGCSRTSANFIVDTIPPKTGISSVTHSKFRLFPNPVKNFVTIEIPAGMQQGNIEIMDITGRVLYQESIQNEGTLHVDLSTFMAGYYTVQLRVNSEIHGLKILKQ